MILILESLQFFLIKQKTVDISQYARKKKKFNLKKNDMNVTVKFYAFLNRPYSGD